MKLGPAYDAGFSATATLNRGCSAEWPCLNLVAFGSLQALSPDVPYSMQGHCLAVGLMSTSDPPALLAATFLE